MSSGRGFQIAEDPRFERRERRAQRVFWVVVAVALVASVLGAFGGTGALSESQRAAAADGSFRVDYDRFGRLKNPGSLAVTLGASTGTGMRTVALSASWLADYELTDVTPDPERVRALPDRYAFTFAARAGATVRFDLEPLAIGLHRATVWGPGGARVAFSQFVYP
jgi:hypothetical protein